MDMKFIAKFAMKNKVVAKIPMKEEFVTKIAMKEKIQGKNFAMKDIFIANFAMNLSFVAKLVINLSFITKSLINLIFMANLSQILRQKRFRRKIIIIIPSAVFALRCSTLKYFAGEEKVCFLPPSLSKSDDWVTIFA